MPVLLEKPINEALPQASEEFVDAGWWPYFSEHVNRNGVRFGEAELQDICDRCNERIDETGDYVPLVLQHTRDNDPNFHPEYAGLIGPFRMGKIGNKKPKWAIFGRERVRSAKAKELKECPRRSVEFWADKNAPTKGFFDPISALPAAVTPELDLGIHYAKDTAGHEVIRYSKVSRYEAAAPGGSNTYAPSGGDDDSPDRYESGGTLSGADLQQIIAALGPTIQEAVKSAVAAMQPVGADPQHLLSPEGEDGADLEGESGDEVPPEHSDMGPTDEELNFAEPGEDAEEPSEEASEGDEEPAGDVEIDDSMPEGDEAKPSKKKSADRYSAHGRESATINFQEPEMAEIVNTELARYQREAADYRKRHDDLRTKYQKLEADNSALKAENTTLKAEKTQAVRYQKLGELQGQGFTFDLEEEVKDCAEMTDAQFDRHCERIAAKYQRVPGGVVGAGVKLASTQTTSSQVKDSKKRERYSKVAMDNVMASRAPGSSSKRLEFASEFNRLMDEDPEKLGA